MGPTGESERKRSSPQTGAATYTFAVPVPPGRNGMAPQLALSYSSQNPLRGGVAAGWRFDVPSIEVDASLGILAGIAFVIVMPLDRRW